MNIDRLFDLYEGRGLSPDQIAQQLMKHIRTVQLPDDYNKACCNHNVSSRKSFQFVNSRIFIGLSVAVSALSVLCMMPGSFITTLGYTKVEDVIRNQPCTVESNMISAEMTRPLFDCNVCRNITQVAVLDDITQEAFTRQYAYTRVPVLIQILINIR